MLKPKDKHCIPFFQREGVNAVMIIAMAVLVILLSIVGPAIYNQQLAYIAAEVEVSQLREDLVKLKGQTISEDAIGQATEYNMLIRRKQAYNKFWWAAWIIPDGWDDMELLEVGDE